MFVPDSCVLTVNNPQRAALRQINGVRYLHHQTSAAVCSRCTWSSVSHGPIATRVSLQATPTRARWTFIICMKRLHETSSFTLTRFSRRFNRAPVVRQHARRVYRSMCWDYTVTEQRICCLEASGLGLSSWQYFPYEVRRQVPEPSQYAYRALHKTFPGKVKSS